MVTKQSDGFNWVFGTLAESHLLMGVAYHPFILVLFSNPWIGVKV